MTAAGAACWRPAAVESGAKLQRGEGSGESELGGLAGWRWSPARRGRGAAGAGRAGAGPHARSEASFSSTQKFKRFQDFLSNRILRHMYEALNID